MFRILLYVTAILTFAMAFAAGATFVAYGNTPMVNRMFCMLVCLLAFSIFGCYTYRVWR